MSPSRPFPRVGLHRRLVITAVLAAAALVVIVVVAFAAAKALTLQIAAAGRVVNTSGASTSEPLAVTGSGRAVYFLSGESPRHPKCTASCLQIWLPVTVPAGTAPSKASGLHGALGVWHRGKLRQVTLAGRPLYTFAADHRAHVATGEGIASFGGTWHVITTRRTGSRAPAPMTPTTSTTATTSRPYGY
ncbi:MAG TPA: hypothetical protein VFN55_04420 [Solirubrobacteraceae bacterium]|nr:hypothetical protein [Solirubrobacteraceae bacterium]